MYHRFGWKAILCGLAGLLASHLNATASSISSPAPPHVPSVAAVYKPGVTVDITGTAGGENFRGFHVEWAPGVNPSPNGLWWTSGITLAGGGTSPVTESHLASWDTSMITAADFYTIRLLVDNTTATNEAKTLVYLEPDLYSTNWPKWIDQGPGYQSILPVRGAAGERRLALVNPVYLSTTVPSKLWLFEVDGSAFTTDELDRGSYMQPAVGELDGNPGEEVVVTGWNHVRVFRPDRSSYFLKQPRFTNFQFSLITLADLDGDGGLEIVTLGRELAISDGWLYAWKADGELFNNNYPVQIPDANSTLRSSERNRVAPVDVDADGKPELLVVAGESSSSFSLRMLRADGTPAPSWPPLILEGTFFGLAVGDLEGDGSVEIALAYANTNEANFFGVYSANGTPRPGWPRQVGLYASPLHVLMADLNRDGTSEVIGVEFSNLYVFKPDGSQFPDNWPIYGGGFRPLSRPVLGDVDGDGNAEIIAMRNNSVFGSPEYTDPTVVAFKANGTVARSWRVLGANGNQPTADGAPFYGDVDGDGNAELAVNYRLISGGGVSGWLHEGMVSVLSLGVPYRPHPRDWPANFHDARNSSAGLIPAKLNLAKSGADAVLSWPVQPEQAVVQFADDLNSNSWNTLSSPVVLSNGTNRVTLNATNAHRWYRLRYQ
jgi:hypothetical protein